METDQLDVSVSAKRETAADLVKENRKLLDSCRTEHTLMIQQEELKTKRQL